MNPADNSPLWIRGARVIDPSAKRDEAKGDVFALDGKFVDQLSAADQAKARVIDGAGLVVAPGFVDLNCRLGEPGRTARETIRTGTRAAAAGGFTTVVTMPDSLPAADNVGTIQLLREICSRDAAVRVLPTGTLTKGHEGKALAPLGTMKKAGVVAVTDTTSGVQNNEIMRRALEYAAMFDLVVLDHCQDSSMTDGGQMHEGAWSLRLGLRGLPRAAEEIVVSSDCLLAELTKARIHLQHLSSGGSAEIVRRAKAKQLSVTAEVSALHLLLTDAALANYATSLKTNPPLREEADRLALIAALVDGTIDAVCSDHSRRRHDRRGLLRPLALHGHREGLRVRPGSVRRRDLRDGLRGRPHGARRRRPRRPLRPHRPPDARSGQGPGPRRRHAQGRRPRRPGRPRCQGRLDAYED